MENLIIQSKKKITLDKFSSSIKFSVSNEIKSILNVSAKSVLNALDQSNNVLTCGGRVFVKVIYLDVEGRVKAGEGSVDFIEKQQVLTPLADMSGSDEVQVVVDTFSGTEILCSVTHNTHIFGIYKQEIADFVGENTSFVLNKKEFVSQKFIVSNSDNFVVAEEQESNVLNMDILSSNAKILNYEIVAAVDKVIIEGKILTETIYADGEGVSTIFKEHEFKHEIETNSAMPNMISYAHIEVKNVTVTPEEKDNKTNIIYAIDVYAKVYVFDDKTYEIANDMFALDSEIQNTYDVLEIENFSSTKYLNDNIISFTNVSDIENFDDIIGVYSPYAKIENVLNEELKVVVEGKIFAYALYKSGEEIKKLDISCLFKTEVEKEANEIYDDSNFVAEISSFKVKAGKELETAIKLTTCVSLKKCLSETFVKSFEIKDSKPVDEGGIKVYVAHEGETVFDVAKVLSVRPEIIEEQNEIDGVFEQGEKIYVYSPINYN